MFKMRFRSFRSILDECLAAIQQGETVETCLARYPRHAERLKPLLSLAARVRRTPPAQPRLGTGNRLNRCAIAPQVAFSRRRTAIRVSFGWLPRRRRPCSWPLRHRQRFHFRLKTPSQTIRSTALSSSPKTARSDHHDTSKADILLDQSDGECRRSRLISRRPIPEDVRP
jgi:hypothetical protein